VTSLPTRHELLAGRPESPGEAAVPSSLIASIYDAAIDPSLWRGVLGDARDFVGGMAAALYAKKHSGLARGVYHDDGGISDHYKSLYNERYAPLDPATPGEISADLEQPVSTSDILDYEEFRQSRFYLEWQRPQGMIDFICAPIDKAVNRTALFSVFRHQRDGMVDGRARMRMGLLVPHIRRAVLITQMIEHRTSQAASFGEALDGLAAGLFFVDPRSRLVHANAAGGDMLGEGVAVTAPEGRLTAVDRPAARLLAEAAQAAGDGDEAVGSRGISVPIEARDGEHFAAHVLPLTSGARRRAGAEYAATAAIFVRRTVLDTPGAPELVARTFGLTPAELRVLLTIVQAGGVAETADTLGVAETTVKTHLQRVFSKTGSSRQADLVKLLAGFASPLAP
jgi:DNA-binding CsgD family transcriptional regulator